LSQRGLRCALLLFLAALPATPLHARTRGEAHHGESWARDHFATAERMREALNGRPQADRTRHDYQRVINAYRNVYFGAPTSTKADPSVVAVAETMVEMGRRFDDDKILNGAIAQYRFLRKEYPGSKYRCDALFTIGEIYKDDLNDPEQARTVFAEFLHRYPHNRLVDDAQQAIAELDREAAAVKKDADKKAAAQPKKAGKETAEAAGSREASAKKRADAATQNAISKNSDAKAAETKIADTKIADAKSADMQTDDAAQASSSSDARESRSNRLPRVTGIRHWSTPDYTRVAIDLENEVKFFSQRIDNPDRIFFDLRDTKLASTLVGKSFDVDDGFLKKIRVAQFQPGRTRVVLEVDDLSDYDAFLLPNPYRLIIDIHGKDGKDTKAAHPKLAKDAVTADVEAAPKGGSEKLDSERTGSETEIAKADVPKVGVAKSEVKADMKALAGEAASKKEQIHNQPKDDRPEVDEENSASAKPREATGKTTEVEVKTATGTIKKVIVDQNTDDDSGATGTAKAGTPRKTRFAPAASTADKGNDTDDSDAAASDETAARGSEAESASGSKLSANRATNKRETDRSLDGAGDRNSANHTSATSSTADLDVHEARPTAGGDRSLIRVLGLKIGKIVIDPGHGGHDTGTIGPNGLEEKDLVLDVGRKLGKLLEARLGAEVVYTRKDDTFIPLETRTAIANQQRADLFISIHANSSHDPAARGVETYYLNFTSSPEALEVAARENAVSEKSIYELQDLVKKIALKEKIEESREFAGDVEQSLHSGLAAKNPGIRDRGVKKAPFIVLIGANMPSILAEISFVSNPGDEHRLETAEYRQRIAESLYRGIARYANGLSGVKVASNKERAAAQ
jgi:N-acetylmuramoyl-L-alanine amidase